MVVILISAFFTIFLSIVLFAVVASQLTFRIGLILNCLIFIILVGIDASLFGWGSGAHWIYFILSLIGLVASELFLADLPTVNRH